MIALFAAFLLGAMGSFHCVGMCGPLALSIPIANNSFSSLCTGSLLYNVGRITTYGLLGALIGGIGVTAATFGIQQWLSVILGSVILIILLINKRKLSGSQQFPLYTVIRMQLGKLYNKGTYSSFYLIGVLNGFLPCGLVYIAMTGSVSMHSYLESAAFMMVFGLGTLPLMWSLLFFGNVISLQIRNKIRKLYPYMMGLMACLLIIRGLELGIPYISPVWHEQKIGLNCHE